MVVAMVGGRRSLVILTSGGLTAETCHQGAAQVFPQLQTRTQWYDIEAKTWTFGQTKPDDHWYYATAAETDPVSGLVLIFGSNGLQLYDPAADSITPATIDPASKYDVAAVGYSNNLVYFPPTDCFYYFERSATATGVVQLVLNRAAKTVLITQLNTVGAPASGESGWAYDSKRQIIGGGIANDVFSAFDPATSTWDSRAMQISSSAGETPNTVVFHALDYDPVDDVYVFLSEPHRRTWAYKYR